MSTLVFITYGNYRTVQNYGQGIFEKCPLDQMGLRVIYLTLFYANIAQLVEQRIRNAQVVGSIPTVGSITLALPGNPGRAFLFKN